MPYALCPMPYARYYLMLLRKTIVNLIVKAISYKKKEGNAVLAPGKILQERYQLQQRLGRTAAGHQT